MVCGAWRSTVSYAWTWQWGYTAIVKAIGYRRSHPGLAPVAALGRFLPRTGAGMGPRALAMGLGILLVVAASGAALVHFIEYHLGLGAGGDARAAAAAMLTQYPLSGGLLLVALFAALTCLLCAREVRRLARQGSQLSGLVMRQGIAPSAPLHLALPRRPARLAQLLAPILAAQTAIYALADHLWPMSPLMRMNGVLMHMPAAGALPLLPLHLAVALVLALLVWRMEHRVIALHAAIARVRRWLQRWLDALTASPLPLCPQAIPLRVCVGPVGFSRPPPR